MNPFASPILYGVPPPTPSSTPQGRKTRPPIINPYDKLTKPQFDSWVDDMTDALRRALRHDLGRDAAGSPLSVEGETGNDSLEDPFTDSGARQAKGKGRDPREGPGLGGKDQVIDLVSDAEHEEDDSGQEQESDGEWNRQEVTRALCSDNSDVEETEEVDVFYVDDDEAEERQVVSEGETQAVDHGLSRDEDVLAYDDEVEEYEVSGHEGERKYRLSKANFDLSPNEYDPDEENDEDESEGESCGFLIISLLYLYLQGRQIFILNPQTFPILGRVPKPMQKITIRGEMFIAVLSIDGERHRHIWRL
jgi:hypothetical protein